MQTKIYLFKAPPENESGGGGARSSKRGHSRRRSKSPKSASKRVDSSPETVALLESPRAADVTQEVKDDKQYEEQAPEGPSEEPQQQEGGLEGPSEGSPQQREELEGALKQPQQQMAVASVEPPQQELELLTLRGGTTATSEESSSTSMSFKKDEDRFITHLKSLGFDAELISTLVFQYSNLKPLWEHLKKPERYSGIIFTSPRCVKSVAEAVKLCDTGEGGGLWEGSLRDQWAAKYVCCVGPSTTEDAEALFGVEGLRKLITGLESHAESLAERIIQEHNAPEPDLELPLLYPCGSLRRDVLFNILKEVPINCEELRVYDSGLDPLLPVRLEPVEDEIKSGQYKTCLVFFSPSGVRHVFESMNSSLMLNENVKLVVIGPTTRESLQNYLDIMTMKKTVYQCDDPTPAALVDLLFRLYG